MIRSMIVCCISPVSCAGFRVFLSQSLPSGGISVVFAVYLFVLIRLNYAVFPAAGSCRGSSRLENCLCFAFLNYLIIIGIRVCLGPMQTALFNVRSLMCACIYYIHTYLCIYTFIYWIDVLTANSILIDLARLGRQEMNYRRVNEIPLRYGPQLFCIVEFCKVTTT